MNPIKRRFFFDNVGHIFFEVNLYGETTVDKDIADFKQLSERNRTTFDVLELPFGAFEQDFRECGGYKVNPITKTLEFAPKPITPADPLVFDRPLSVQVEELRQRDASIQDDQLFIMEILVNNNLI